jgi:hypothetical protein
MSMPAQGAYGVGLGGNPFGAPAGGASASPFAQQPFGQQSLVQQQQAYRGTPTPYRAQQTAQNNPFF